MKKEEIIKKLETADSSVDFILRSDSEEKTFLDNHKQRIIEEEVSPAISSALNSYDDVVFEVTGKKKAGQKTTEFIKSQFTELKGKAEKVGDLETEIAELKKGKPDDAKLQEIKDLQRQLQDLKRSHDKQLEDFGKQSLKNNVRNEIERGLLGIKMKAGIPDSMKQVYVDNIINELSSNAEVRDGKIVFLDTDGKAMRDPHTLAPYTAEAILKEKMKDVIDAGIKQEPVKLPKETAPIAKSADGKTLINFVVPPEITSREKYGEWLVKEMGIKRGSPDYREAMVYASKDLKLPAVD